MTRLFNIHPPCHPSVFRLERLARSRARARSRLLILAGAITALISLAACEDEPSGAPASDNQRDQGEAQRDQERPRPDLAPLADRGADLDADRAPAPIDMEPRWDLEPPEGAAWAAVPEADEQLFAGISVQPLGYPLGSAVVGFGPREGVKTPFASLYPGTAHQHTALTAKALVLRRQGKVIALVRLDMIGVWQELVADIQGELRRAGRGDLAAGLIIAATHTHASGGRIFDHLIGTIAVGTFYPPFYQRVRGAILDAVLEADARAEESQLGIGAIQVPELHSDRRCANGPQQDDTMALIKVSDADGALKAVVVNYAMHGTVINNDQGCLSGDAPHAIEDALESRLEGPAVAFYLQSWAGDMSPEAPQEQIGEGRALREEYEELDAIGAAAAARIIPALEEIALDPTPEIAARTYRFPLRNALINPGGEFDRYPYGGIYCMSEEEICPPEPISPEELACVPIPPNATVDWTQITAAKIGSWGLVTLPGEPLTSVGVELRDRAAAVSDLEGVMVVGYAQSYLSYLLHPDDYFLGGYEAASALMGPGFGQYLIDRGVDAIAWLTGAALPAYPPVPRVEVPPPAEAPLRVEEALGAPEWLAAPQLIEGEDRIELRWIGGDPATDTPVVTIERLRPVPEGADGGIGEWAPLTHRSGRVVSSDGPEIELSLTTEPSYEEDLSEQPRRFLWRAQMPLRFPTEPSFGQPQGMLRFSVEGERPEPYRLLSESVEIP